MKAKVIKSFRDRETTEALKVGREIEITEERFEELVSSPLGVFVEEIQEEKTEEPPTDKEEEKTTTDKEPSKEKKANKSTKK